VNFLGHLFLSGNDQEVQLGNFIGDFVKGRTPQSRFPEKLAAGILLHREIDQFTDRHPCVKSSKDRIRHKYRHYSGVVIDIFYDHFLAAQWRNYHPTPLGQFAEQVYQLVQSNSSHVPERALHMLPHMIRGNWLVAYASLEGIRSVLNGMSRRTPYASGMEFAAEDLQADYTLFQQEFESFIIEAEAMCQDYLRRHGIISAST